MHDVFKKYFVKKQEWVSILVGHCINGKYLIVPKTLFGTDTILLDSDQYEYQMLNILENKIKQRLITKDCLDTYRGDQFSHVVNHQYNGRHLIRFNRVNLHITVDQLNDELQQQYDAIVDYIKLKQKYHDLKMEMRSIHAILEHLRHTVYGASGKNYLNKLERLNRYRDEYIRCRTLAKQLCETKERFDAIIHYYWVNENLKNAKRL